MATPEARDDDDFAHDSDADNSDDDSRATAAAGAASRAEGGGGGGNAFELREPSPTSSGKPTALPRARSSPRPRNSAARRRSSGGRSARGRWIRNIAWNCASAHVVPKRGVADPSRIGATIDADGDAGVVRLFNAVSQAQRAAADAVGLGGKSKQLTKSKFLAELKKSTAGERGGRRGGRGC